VPNDVHLLQTEVLDAPAEANPVLIIYPDAVLALAITFQSFKPTPDAAAEYTC